MSDEVLGLIRENLSETMRLRDEVHTLTRRVDAHIIEHSRPQVVQPPQVAPAPAQPAPAPAPAPEITWAGVASKAIDHKPLRWAALVMALGFTGLGASEIRDLVVSAAAQADAEPDVESEEPPAEPESPQEDAE